jgi:hypothetical protein
MAKDAAPPVNVPVAESYMNDPAVGATSVRGVRLIVLFDWGRLGYWRTKAGRE